MIKRSNDTLDTDSPYRKRQKLTENQVVKPVAINVQSSQDLKTHLAFNQDTTAEQLRQNIKAFKNFLDSIAYGEDDNDRSFKRTILLEYLQSQTTPANNQDARYLSDVVQSWSFAVQSNNERLSSAIIAVLALFLKATSTFIEFREYGNTICKTLLEEDQIKLFERGISASKTKEHVISPCLRLLTEILSYDGGTAAQSVYAHRATTFKRLDVFLSMRKNLKEAVPENQRRPSIRHNALRYLFANLRLQTGSAKSSILTDGKLIRAVFRDIKEDSAALVLEILKAFKTDVVQDLTLSHLVKSRVFTEWTLRSIASLYQPHHYDNAADDIAQVQREAHIFLLCICTTADQGVLRLHPEARPEDEPGFAYGDNHTYPRTGSRPKSQKQGPVRNTILALFLQSLRPYADTLQCELILAVFQAAPDLISEYFHKTLFSFEPKLTTTWVGYSMFLLSSIQLPIPKGQLDLEVSSHVHTPPHLSSMIDGILPQPMTKKALTRCLNQSTGLIKFIGVRILVAAFQKLATVQKRLASASLVPQSKSSNLWRQAEGELLDEFRRRCPEMRHVIAVFRSCPDHSALFRETTTRLIAMYYKFLPQVALEEKFDISVTLSEALKANTLDVEDLQCSRLHKLEIYSLLEIARRSPGMRWWHKTDGMLLSPFTTLLRLHVVSPNVYMEGHVEALLRSIIEETTILNQDANHHRLGILTLSLQDCANAQASDSLYEFIDNCLLRCSRKPVKYYDDLTALVSAIRPSVGVEVNDCKIDLLLVTILDQWPFFVKSAAAMIAEAANSWLSGYMGLLMHTGSNKIVLSNIRDQFMGQVTSNRNRSLLKGALRAPPKSSVQHELRETNKFTRDKSANLVVHLPESRLESFEDFPIPELPAESEDYPVLRKWTQKETPEAIRDGSVGQLILCLCSKHEEIRKQAIVALRSFSGGLQLSGYREWQQTYMLIGELMEAAHDFLNYRPLPYFAGVIASRALLVVAEPLHFMYTKINRFLNKAPRWDIDKLPSYWVHKILLHPPADDNAHYDEVGWLLEVLTDGLRTPEDMEIYRRSDILERLLSMSATSLRGSCKQKMLSLLFRCTFVGGSTTLITRCGLLSWVHYQIKSHHSTPPEHAGLRKLALRTYETSDQEHVKQWSNGFVGAMLDSVQEHCPQKGPEGHAVPQPI